MLNYLVTYTVYDGKEMVSLTEVVQIDGEELNWGDLPVLLWKTVSKKHEKVGVVSLVNFWKLRTEAEIKAWSDRMRRLAVWKEPEYDSGSEVGGDSVVEDGDQSDPVDVAKQKADGALETMGGNEATVADTGGVVQT